MPDCEARMAAILEAAPYTIIAIDERGVIESVNAAAERMFGYRTSELVGRAVSILMAAPHTGAVTLLDGEREIPAQRADGTIFPAHLSIVEVPMKGKHFFTGFLTDLTELKRVERMQNEFVSMVNHELRTPLTSIKSALGIVKTGTLGDLPEEMRRMIEIAYGNCDRLIRIINDLLDMEKIASGALRFEFKGLELRAFLDSFFAANKCLGRDFNVELVLIHAPEDMLVDIDPERFGQVLTNLVSNAVKFSPDGATVKIIAERKGAWVRLSVEDRGPGISDAFKSRVFTRFAQEDSSTIRKKGGNGLGLSISKAIVEAHGGQIGFETEIGQGTTFFVDLPLIAKSGAGVLREHSGDHRILAMPVEAGRWHPQERI